MSQHELDVLGRVGRNVVNFQKLEFALRRLAPLLQGTGSLSDLQAATRQADRSLSKKSLGDLAGVFNSRAFSNQPLNESSLDVTEVTVAWSLHFEPATGDVHENKRALRKLVEERNRLIHRDLASFDFDSPDKCSDLARLLDEQNERICQQLSFLEHMSNAQAEAMLEFIRQMTSEGLINPSAAEHDAV